MKKAVWIVALVALPGLFGGCFVRGYATVPTVEAHVVAPPPPTIVGSVSVSTPPPPTIVGTLSPVVVGTAQAYTTTCNPNAAEVLNGIDDNCNGMVDEGFVGTGTLQFALSWASTADLDLHVFDPHGFEIDYEDGQRASPSGGQLDRDDRGACYTEEDPIVTDNSENVYWAGNPPGGHYSVHVHNYDACNSYGATTFVLTVLMGGEAQAFQATVQPGEDTEVISFDL
ncbi:MAG: putative metal-binding motif-containing protein [Deltaproteobacteria bacterium]|nr:putative metal-binding motif-containing protein [Deltaproteobacteria bacterium]